MDVYFIFNDIIAQVVVTKLPLIQFVAMTPDNV